MVERLPPAPVCNKLVVVFCTAIRRFHGLQLANLRGLFFRPRGHHGQVWQRDLIGRSNASGTGHVPGPGILFVSFRIEI